MKARQRTEVKIETLERTVIRFGQSGETIFCRACQTSTRHFTIVQAVSIFGLSEHLIIQRADEQELHSTQINDGSLMVCGNSLATQTEE